MAIRLHRLHSNEKCVTDASHTCAILSVGRFLTLEPKITQYFGTCHQHTIFMLHNGKLTLMSAFFFGQNRDNLAAIFFTFPLSFLAIFCNEHYENWEYDQHDRLVAQIQFFNKFNLVPDFQFLCSCDNIAFAEIQSHLKNLELCI